MTESGISQRLETHFLTFLMFGLDNRKPNADTDYMFERAVRSGHSNG